MTTESNEAVENTETPAVDRGDDFTPPTEPTVDNTEPTVDKEVDKPEAKIDEKQEKVEDKQEDVSDKKEDKEPAQRDDKGRFIPKHRFTLRTQQLRQAEDEIRRLQQENTALKTPKAEAAPAVTDLDTQLAAIDEKIFTARKDGDLDAERKLLTESRRLQQAHFQAELKAARTEASTAAVETMTLDSVIDEIEGSHPFLDPKSEDFDKERADELVELWEAYELKGYSKANALLKATAILLPEAADAPAPEPAPEPAKPAPRKTDIKKNIDAARKTPPKLDDVGGLDSDKGGIRDAITPSKLSEKDFEALPDSVLKKLRGDYL